MNYEETLQLLIRIEARARRIADRGAEYEQRVDARWRRMRDRRICLLVRRERRLTLISCAIWFALGGVVIGWQLLHH